VLFVLNQLSTGTKTAQRCYGTLLQPSPMRQLQQQQQAAALQAACGRVTLLLWCWQIQTKQ
jgi:hypothetical protein